MKQRRFGKGATYRDFPCDLCGSTEAVEVPHCREYTGNQPIHICVRCGFVYVLKRRSAKEIADTWSNEIFGDHGSAGTPYTAAIPAVKARQTYVAEFIQGHLGMRGKKVCDIGAGEGRFLELIRREPYEAEVFGIEPSVKNCESLRRLGIPHFQGTVESCASGLKPLPRFDLVTILWTLENCQSCLGMLKGARKMLADGGSIVVATGSRILVPFKKPLHLYLSKNPADTHCFRFSANTLRGVLAVSGFEIFLLNRYLDSDILCVMAQKVEEGREIPWEKDNYPDVVGFFERWHVETKKYFYGS